MAAQRFHRRGWLDTRESIIATFQEDRHVKELKTRNATEPITHGDLNVSSASKWAYFVTYGTYRVAGGKIPDQHHIQAVSIGELIAPVLPDSYFMSQADANAMIKRILVHYASHETLVNRGRKKASFITAHNQLVNEGGVDAEGLELINVEITDAQCVVEHGQNFVEFLLMSSTTDNNLVSIDIFSILYVAVSKRGNVTEDFLTKISRGLQDDLQHESKLSAETIDLVYMFYGGYITANNAQEIMDRWLNDIPEVALRVRLTLQQATNSGLTALVTCGRAMRKYPDFPWARLNNLTGGELSNFQAAVNLVQGNQYYGFNKSLGAARSIMYSSLSYVAKELLVALNGEVSLRKYAGWVRAPKNAAVIKVLIKAYKQAYTDRMESGEVGAEDNQVSTDLQRILGDGVNANLFA